MKAVIYARYSSDNQREESIEGQIRECKEFAEHKGMTILNSYIDRALSAKTDNRPEFQRMIRDSAKGLFDIVIVWKLDRFARNRYDSAHYKAILKKNNVRVISAKESIAEDSTGILLESLLEGYAEFYSAELSEKVSRGMKENALKCKWNGGGIPVGFVIDSEQHYQIDPLTAPLVQKAFQKYADGGTIKGLADWLNGQGIQSYRNRRMRIDTVKRMLHNRRYIGEYRYKDVIVPGGIPAIIEEPLFQKVQERMEKNKKAPARFKAEDKYLLTTKLFCGKCGAYMVGESGTSRTMKVHHYYKCVTAKNKKTCKKKTVQKDWIETLVLEKTMEMLSHDSSIERIVKIMIEYETKENTNLPLLKKQLSKAEKAIDNMLNAIQEGIFNPSTKQRLDKLEQTKEDLEVRIIQEEMQKPVLTPDKIRFWLYKFRQLDIGNPEHQQILIDTFINAIYLYDDKIVFTYNGREDTETITLSDIESSDLETLGAPETDPGLFQLEKARICFLLDENRSTLASR